MDLSVLTSGTLVSKPILLFARPMTHRPISQVTSWWTIYQLPLRLSAFGTIHSCTYKMDDQEKMDEFLKDFYPCDADSQDSHSSIKGAFLEKGLQRFICPSFNCLHKSSPFFVCCRFIFLHTSLNSQICNDSLLHSFNFCFSEFSIFHQIWEISA